MNWLFVISKKEKHFEQDWSIFILKTLTSNNYIAFSKFVTFILIFLDLYFYLS